MGIRPHAVDRAKPPPNVSVIFQKPTASSASINQSLDFFAENSRETRLSVASVVTLGSTLRNFGFHNLVVCS